MLDDCREARLYDDSRPIIRMKRKQNANARVALRSIRATARPPYVGFVTVSE